MPYRGGNGLRDLEKRLAKIPAEIKKQIGPAIVTSAEEIADIMRYLAPKKTGDLARSIVVTPPGGTVPPYSQGSDVKIADNAAAITAGNTEVRYAHLVEFGTRPHEQPKLGRDHSCARAKPFFFPGYRMGRKRVKARVSRAITKAVKGR